MKIKNFPDDPIRPGSLVPPTTIRNVAHLLEREGIRCRYNEVKKKVEIELPRHHGTSDNRDNVTMAHVISRAAEEGMQTGHVGEFVNAVADQHAYNPAADWIRSQPWDDVDRLPSFCATVTAQPDYPERLKEALLRKWLRSAAAAAATKGYKGRGVLTLQGEQGLGKTSWVRALISDPELRESLIKIDHHLDAGSKDSIITAVSHWIVEIGELDSSLKRDVARLKGFLTADSDKLRRPFDRRDSEYARRTVFTATVNDGRFLVDQTGNSRFWTIACAGLDYRHTIDMQQLFAQALLEVDAGEPWWLDQEEERLLADWNQRHMAVSVIAEELEEWLDRDRIGAEGLPAMTPTVVLRVLNYDRPTNAQAKECAAALREVLGPSKRINGADKWRVPLRNATAADLELDPLKAAMATARAPADKTVCTNEIY
ncbi:VapE domain-containing protein [Sphingomonas sp.]|uniref:VapE domain-containing protein n=1 Tax=Sphingomonas sp. TaxID=28214 RepID=UPI003CC6CE5F